MVSLSEIVEHMVGDTCSSKKPIKIENQRRSCNLQIQSCQRSFTTYFQWIYYSMEKKLNTDDWNKIILNIQIG